MSVFSELLKTGGGRFTTNPQLIPWNICHDGYAGLISEGSPKNFQSDDAWTALTAAGEVTQVAVDDTYVTVAEVASGSGIITNVVLPGVTAAADVVSVKFTIDGTETELSFTVEATEDRVWGGLSIPDDANSGLTEWWNTEVISGIAVRQESTGGFVGMVSPAMQPSFGVCLQYTSSMKVEMKCSNVDGTTNRDDCAVVYTEDQ